jgi:hypothetical protein
MRLNNFDITGRLQLAVLTAGYFKFVVESHMLETLLVDVPLIYWMITGQIQYITSR